MWHLQQRDDRSIVPFRRHRSVAGGRVWRIEDVVGQKHRKRFVADRLSRLKHRMAESKRLG